MRVYTGQIASDIIAKIARLPPRTARRSRRARPRWPTGQLSGQAARPGLYYVPRVLDLRRAAADRQDHGAVGDGDSRELRPCRTEANRHRRGRRQAHRARRALRSVEAERLAYADRDKYVADTRLRPHLPGGSANTMLRNKPYAASRAALISPTVSMGTATAGNLGSAAYSAWRHRSGTARTSSPSSMPTAAWSARPHRSNRAWGRST